MKAVVDMLVGALEAEKLEAVYRPLSGGELYPVPASWWRGELIDHRFITGQLNPRAPFHSSQRGAYIFLTIGQVLVTPETDAGKLHGVHTSSSDAAMEAPAVAPKRGRRAGSGSYAALDEPLLNEMKVLMDSGAAVSADAAAKMVADKAKGDGTFDSKKTRLAKSYRAKYGD